MFILVVNLNLIIVIKPISLLMIFLQKKIKNLKLNYKNTIFVKANETSKSYENISPIITALLSKKIDKSSTIVCIEEALFKI